MSTSGLAQPEMAVIEGRVTDESGKPVTGVYVAYTRTTGGTSSKQAGHAQIQADGAFKFQGLAAGTYALCIQSPGQTYLDPCIWSSPAATVALSADQSRKNLDLRVRSGVRLRIKILDPEQRLKPAGSRLDIGIRLPNGFFHRIPVVSQGAKGPEYETVIPTGQALHLSIEMLKVGLIDQWGHRLDPGRAAIAVTAAKDEREHTIEFTTVAPLQ